LSKKYFNLFRNSKQGKLLAANYNKQVITNENTLPVPSRETMLEALADEYGATFRIVYSSYRIEKPDGSRVSVKPWAEANVVGLPSENVGRLVYGTLAEETNPVAGVNYQKSGSHILVAKYSKTDPLKEFTTAQALALPVIDGVDSIYILHADSTGEELSVNTTSLAFPKSGSSKTFDVHYDGDASELTIEADEEWLSVTLSGNKVTVKAAANTEAERTGKVTVTDKEDNSVEVSVTQAAGNA